MTADDVEDAEDDDGASWVFSSSLSEVLRIFQLLSPSKLHLLKDILSVLA